MMGRLWEALWEALWKAIVAVLGRRLPEEAQTLVIVGGGVALLALVLYGFIRNAPYLAGRGAASAKKAKDWALEEYEKGLEDAIIAQFLRPFSPEEQRLLWKAREGMVPLDSLPEELRKAEVALAELMDQRAHKEGILHLVGDTIMIDDSPWTVVSMTRGRAGIVEGTVTLERLGRQMIVDFDVVNPEYRGFFVPFDRRTRDP